MITWNTIFKTRAQDWVHYPMDISQTPGDIPIADIHKDTKYIHVYLKSMRIVDVRKGLSKFYGAVHSQISVKHRSGKPASFTVVTTPETLANITSKNIDRVILENIRLLGPVPFRGGEMKMEIGLFSIKSEDLAKPFLTLLQDMSKLSGVSFISSALPYAETITKGINLITEGEETTLEIGISKNFDPVQTGYYVVMRAPQDEVDVSSFMLGKDFKLLDKNKKPIADYPYFVYQISCTDKREDWFEIPDVLIPYKKLQEDTGKGDFNAALESLKAFKRAVLSCNDLLIDDAKAIISVVETEAGEAMKTGQVSMRVMPKLKSLSAYKLPA